MFCTGVHFIVLKLSAQVCRQKTIFRQTFLNDIIFSYACGMWCTELTSWLGPLVKFRQQSRLVKLCSYTLNVKRPVLKTPVLVNPLMPSLSYLTHLIQKRSPVQQIWYNLQLIYANYYLINQKKKKQLEGLINSSVSKVWINFLQLFHGSHFKGLSFALVLS